MFFHTREWSVNTDKILSVEWNTDLKEAYIFLCDGRSYTLGEVDPGDYHRLAKALKMEIESKLVNLPYINKQKTYYFQYLKSGRRPAALDALWRAASNSNLLLDGEVNHEKFTRERIAELLFMLDWNE